MNSVTRMTSLTASIGFVVLLACLWPAPTLGQSSKGRNNLQAIQERHKERFREFSTQITKLAQFCDEKNLDDAASKVRSRMIVPEAQSLRVDKLPTEMRAEILPGVSGDERYWQTQLRHLEIEYAKDLYGQSRGALHQGFPGYAYNLVREAALHDPDHPQVRKILGFVRLGGEWVTPFAFSQVKTKGNVWHEEFGWLPRSQIERYMAGERNFKGRWISAEKEKELRRDFNSAWEIRTDHYLIKTNVSLERGVEMGKALEDFYGVFHETFAGFFHTPEQLQKLFDGTSKSMRADKPYTVHFYRTREEYLERLRKFFPSIDQTNGVYMTHDRVAHFYYDPANDHDGTLFHEATHQLFFESHHSNRTISERNHFWIRFLWVTRAIFALWGLGLICWKKNIMSLCENFRGMVWSSFRGPPNSPRTTLRRLGWHVSSCNMTTGVTARPWLNISPSYTVRMNGRERRPTVWMS